MPNDKEEGELLRKLGKLSLFWFTDNAIPMTPEKFRRAVPSISRRTGMSMEELWEVYAFAHSKTLESAQNGSSAPTHTIVKGFRRDDTPTQSG